MILGSLPGRVSLAKTQYYAHPQNHFWRLIGAVIERELVPLTYPERLAALLAAGVGLWDVVASGRRKGSLDADLRLHEANDLGTLAAGLPRLKAIGFNGGKSAAIGRRQLAPGIAVHLLNLPSSSPAYTLSFEQKRDTWLGLRAFL